MKRINILSVQQVRDRSVQYDFKTVTSPERAAKIINALFNLESAASEYFGILNLSVKQEVNGAHIISQGTLDATLVHPREIFKAAFLNNAASIILFHNHPSGNPQPSNDDIQMTKRIREAGTLLGIEVLDHIIIGDQKFCSMKELGLWV